MHLKKEQLEMNMEHITGSNLGKEHVKAIYSHPSYLTYLQSTSCKILGLNEAQAGIKIAGRNINNLTYADVTILIAESKEELKKLLVEGERGE